MTPEELAKLLETEPTELRRAGEQILPRSEAGQGFSVEPLERIAERLDQEGDVLDVLSEHGGIVQHLQWALGTYFVMPASLHERIEVVSGEFLELSDEARLLSGRQRPAVLRVLLDGVPSEAYVLDGARAEVWTFPRSIRPAEVIDVVVPELREFTADLRGSADVEAEFRALRTSASALDRLAAPGALLRFWLPDNRAVRQQLLASPEQDAPLLVAVRGWYASLSESVRAGAEQLALAEVDDLRRLLAELNRTDAADAMEELATRVALGRDRLESVRRVVVAAGTGARLTRAARSLDNFAAIHLTQLADSGVSAERLGRVRLSEPDAWWALISDSSR